MGTMKKAQYGMQAPMSESMMKNGGKKMMKKAKDGTAFGMLSVKAGVDKNPNPTAADRIAGAKKTMKKAQYGVNMTAGAKKAKMENGGGLKAVDKGKNPGLAKLPTPVRNKMGYAKSGGALKKQAAIAIAMKKAGKTPKANSGMSMMKGGGKMHKMPNGSMMKNSKMKMGGKCKNGC